MSNNNPIGAPALEEQPMLGIDDARNLRAAAVKITEDSDPAKQWTWALGEER